MVTGRATQKVSEMKNYFFEKMNNMNTFSNKWKERKDPN